jgi:hypothetical protein
MCNLSSSDAPLFVRFAEEMHAAIMAAGPNPIRAARSAEKKPSAPCGAGLHP